MSSRRAAGESSISKGEDGRWNGFVSFGVGDGGRRDRRHVSGRTRAEVVRRVRDLERQRDAGLTGTTTKAVTVEQWLTHWCDTIAATRVRPSTLVHYRAAIRNQLVPKIGHVRLDRLQPEHIERAYAELVTSGTGLPSVEYAHRVLARSLKVAQQRGRVARNVAQLVDAPRAARVEIRPLTLAEARAVLRAAEGTRNGARWWVALALGLCQGEALPLRWSDIDLDAGTLTVRRQVQRLTGRGLVFSEPKSRAGNRTVALPGPVIDALRLHRKQQLEERLAAGSTYEDADLIFAQANGRVIDPRADYQAWRDLLSAAGVRPARLHDARHTAATVMLSLGVPARVAMETLGHSDVRVTLGTYSHVVPEIAADAAERVGAALYG